MRGTSVWLSLRISLPQVEEQSGFGALALSYWSFLLPTSSTVLISRSTGVGLYAPSGPCTLIVVLRLTRVLSQTRENRIGVQEWVPHIRSTWNKIRGLLGVALGSRDRFLTLGLIVRGSCGLVTWAGYICTLLEVWIGSWIFRFWLRKSRLGARIVKHRLGCWSSRIHEILRMLNKRHWRSFIWQRSCHL